MKTAQFILRADERGAYSTENLIQQAKTLAIQHERVDAIEFLAEPVEDPIPRSPYYYEVHLSMVEPGQWDTQEVLFSLRLCTHNCTHFCDVKVANKPDGMVFGCRPLV